MKKPITILFIDDDPNVLKLYGTALASPEFSIIYASGCREARDLLKRTAPDLIVCDIALQDVDGIECMTMIREEIMKISKKLIPFVFLSNFGDRPEDLEMVKEMGGLDLIHKSIGPAGFAERMKLLCAKLT